MEKIITPKNEYISLDALYEVIKTISSLSVTKEYDSWEVRRDSNGQMAQCIVVKKSAMHAIKLYLTNTNEVKINYIIPNKMMHAYFGKSVKVRRDIIEILTGKIKDIILAPSQKKVFEELQTIVSKTIA